MTMKQHATRFFAVAMMLACGAAGVLAAPPSPAAKPVAIRVRSQHPAIDLAAAELVRYLGQMAGDPEAAAVVTDLPPGSAAIELGLAGDLGVTMEGLRDARLDDAVHVDVRGSQGVIAGSNPRSVLFATYRFLEECGCRWIRPGKDGDYVPSRCVHDLSSQVSDRAFYRFRGNNNCGAYSLDQMLDKIAWAPKVGLNTFFNEFFLPRGIYNQYYGREYPSLKNSEPRCDEEIRAYHEMSVREIKRRGMHYHAVGHGWTTLALGLPESESDHWARPATPPGKEWMLAMVDGKRDLSRGPTFTDLCYGNPEVQRRLVRCVADYAARHPDVDYLHVWFDDRLNNSCECDLCKDTKLSDFYVRILKRIDAEMTRRNLDAKIVFLTYVELLWPPEKERFEGQDRFVLMFAPISRNYAEPYTLEKFEGELPKYALNQYKLPGEVPVNVAFLREWQKLFQGPGFAFDYHMTWHHYTDLGYYAFARIMAEDIRRLPQIGLDGYVSCQVLKAYFPTGFPMDLHARMLWNPEREFDALAREYFAGAFGKDSGQALEYTKSLSDNSLLSVWIPSGGEEKAKGIEKLTKAKQVIDAFRPLIDEHLEMEDPAQRLSWKYLALHGEISKLLCDALLARAENNPQKEEAAWQALADGVAEREAETDPVLDIRWFLSRFPAKNLKPTPGKS